jgi:hypothetical protein
MKPIVFDLLSRRTMLSSLRPLRPSVPVAALLTIQVLVGWASADEVSTAQRAKDALIVKTLLRLQGVDLSAKPEAKAALLRHLETLKGAEQYLELVEKFNLRETGDELLKLAVEQSETTAGVKAAGLLVKFDERERLTKAIADPDPSKGAKIVTVIGLLSVSKTNELLTPMIADPKQPLAIRAAAVGAVGRNAPGKVAARPRREEGIGRRS